MNMKYIRSHILKLALMVLLISNHGYKLYGSTNAIETGISPPKSEQCIEKYIYKKTPQGELAMYVHFPEDWTTNDKRPAIVFFFGGGWVGGNVEELVPHAEYLAKRGMVTARADYRIKSRHGTMPDKCVEDGKSAIRWLRVNAAKLGIDPNRIVASGVSAGGHVAASTCTTKGLEAQGEETSISSKPNLLVLFEPVLQCAGLVREVGSKEMAVRISPYDNLTKDITPLVVLCGMEDWLVVEAVEFVEKCKKLGIVSELYTAEGQEHGALLKLPWLERAIYLMDKFLARHGYTQGEPTIKLTESKAEMKKILPASLNIRDTWAYTPLHRAVRNGQKELVKVLIANGADVNAKDNWFTPLFYTFRCGDKELVEFLIDNGADVNAKSRWGRTPLYHAAGRGDKELIELFIAKGADVNVTDPTGNTPLHNAVKSRAADKDIIELLITKRATLNAKNNDGHTPIDVAFQQNRKDIVQLLLAKGATISSIHVVAQMGDLAGAKALLEQGADVNAQDDKGTTPLHYAVQEGHKEVAEFLIAKGADVNVKDKEGYTPLYYAIWNEDKDMVRLLMTKGADVNLKPEKDYPPLHYAVWNKDLDMVKLFVAQGAKFDVKDQDGWTAFRYAASQGNRDIVEFFIAKGADVSSFHMAACMGDLTHVKRFVEQGADVNTKDELGWTPLYWAASTGQTDVVEFLIAKGANINAKTNDGTTMLHQAAQAGAREVAELFISKGTDVNTKAKNGNTPLHSAASAGHREMIELLIAKGANVDAKGRNDWTPLHRAARSGHGDIVEFLVEKGADVDAKASSDHTALHSAAVRGRKDMAALLIVQGADLDSQNVNGQTPLHLSARRGRRDMVELLINKGADVSIRNKWGRTPLDLAVDQGHTEIIELLRRHGAKEYSKELEAPLLQAVEKGDVEEVKLLLAKGADVNTQDFRGTLLHIATLGNHKSLVESLIAAGAIVDAQNAAGNSPLHYAAVYGHRDIVELLIKNGANVEVRDLLGYTPLHWAASGGHSDVAELLIVKGADVNARQKEDLTPLHEATKWGHPDVVELLISKGAEVEAQDKNGRIPSWYAKAGGNEEIVALLPKTGRTHDLAVTGVSVRPSCTQGDHVVVVVDVLNRSDYSETIGVTLTDNTDGVPIGTKSVRLSPTGVDGMDEICDLTFLPPTTDHSYFGAHMGCGGDVNGDGHNDLVITAQEWNSGAGRAYLYYGGLSMDAKPDKTFEGEHPGDRFGQDVCLGDVNGDGYADVIIGAVFYGNERGRVYIYYGGRDMDSTCDLTLDGEAGTAGRFGRIVVAGDVNNDKYDDVFVTAPVSATHPWKGRVYLYYGGPSMDSKYDRIFEGENDLDAFGRGVAIGGDVDGDGYRDILIGADRVNRRGRAYLYYGNDKANMDTACDLVFACPESGTNDFAYVELSDVDGDGHADVLVGARIASNFQGRVYLYWGNTRSNMDAIPDKIFSGEEDGRPNLGGNAVHCGYFNNDRYKDIAVAGYAWYRSNQMGRVYIYDGNTKAVMDESPDKILTGTLWSRFGAYFSMGDLNNDNYDDIVAGGYRHNSHQGKAWMYYGGPGDSTQLKFDWDTTNASIGKHTLKVEIPPVPGEKDISNNTMTVTVEVKEPSK